MDDDAVILGEVSESGLLSLPDIEPIPVSDLVDAFNSRIDAVTASFDETGGTTLATTERYEANNTDTDQADERRPDQRANGKRGTL
ncbi:MAG: hypothetical protein GKR86_10540 [Ilumatobacter sp.]|nr:hypothetical protein [Ilumatobacter sp.]